MGGGKEDVAQSTGLLRSSEVVVVILSALMVLSLLDSRRAHRTGHRHTASKYRHPDLGTVFSRYGRVYCSTRFPPAG